MRTFFRYEVLNVYLSLGSNNRVGKFALFLTTQITNTKEQLCGQNNEFKALKLLISDF